MPPPYYDATLGGIALPTMHVEGFSETIGGDYELVGAVPLPGPPRPRLYNMAIPIYGDMHESNPYAVGNTKRTQVRDLLENDATRFAGINYTVVYDSQLNAVLVIGAAELAYAGGPDFGDFELRIGGAAVVPAVLILGAMALSSQDKRLQTTPLDARRLTGFRSEDVSAEAKPRHYLPVGAYDVVGQVEPRFVPLHSYRTIFGEGVYIEDRTVDGEIVTFEKEWDPTEAGTVRAFDVADNPEPQITKEGDIDPETGYGWHRVYGRRLMSTPPVLDNGVCRVSHVKDSVFQLETVSRDRYTRAEQFDLGYGQVISTMLDTVDKESITMKLQLGDKGRRGTAYVTLQRGWQGPSVDVTHLAKQSKVRTDAEALHERGEGWEHLRIGAGPTEALFHATQEPRLVTR
jgi:hypothetical protein